MILQILTVCYRCIPKNLNEAIRFELFFKIEILDLTHFPSVVVVLLDVDVVGFEVVVVVEVDEVVDVEELDEGAVVVVVGNVLVVVAGTVMWSHSH